MKVHYIAAPMHTVKRSGLKDTMSGITKAIQWTGELSNSINTLLSAGSPNTKIGDLETAKQAIVDFLNPSNEKYSGFYKSNSVLTKTIPEINKAIHDFLNTFIIHIDGGKLGDWRGYDAVLTTPNPNRANTPIRFGDFMDAVHNNDRRGVQIDTNGSRWDPNKPLSAHWNVNMPDFYNQHKADAYLQLAPGANEAESNALKKLMDLLQR